MYLNQLFSNFEDNIIDYMSKNNVIPVNEIATVGNSNYHQKILNRTDRRLSHFHVSSDIFKFIQYFFKVNDSVITELRELVALVDVFFQPENLNKPMKFNENNFIVAQFSSTFVTDDVNSTKDCSIVFRFDKANLVLKINDENELSFGDLGYFVPKSYTLIDSNDVSGSFLTAISLFKKELFKVIPSSSGIIDQAYIENLNGMTIEKIIQSRLETNDLYHNFMYRSRESLLAELKLLKTKYPTSGVRLMPDGMIFCNDDIPLFLYTMKTMFPKHIYSNIEKAANFYHIYHVLMNEIYDIQVQIYIKDKLDNIDNIITVTMGDIVFDVALNNNQYYIDQSQDSNRITLFEIYQLDLNRSRKNVIQTNDFNELYEYTFNQYSSKLSDILNKSVSTMTLDDAKVLLMYNF